MTFSTTTILAKSLPLLRHNNIPLMVDLIHDMALYLVGAKQSVQSLAALTRDGESGINIHSCQAAKTVPGLVYCQATGSILADICDGTTGVCKLPAPNTTNATALCAANASSTSLAATSLSSLGSAAVIVKNSVFQCS